ncbi:MAG: hypothetical protein OSJ43_11620 [Oscillospiraceae bacterium]|nr:hypothetical protein [Oscillospiraceae bacterium]
MGSNVKALKRELDKQIIECCTSGWMEDNISNTSNNVKCHKNFSSLQVREKRFRVDEQDTSEDGFFFVAANILAEFQRTKVVPEIDAYRYSKLNELAGVKSIYSPAKQTIFSQLSEQINYIRTVVGNETKLIISMARQVYDIILLSSKLRSVSNTKFQQGDREFWVNAIDGADIIPVPTARMKTSYIFDSYSGIAVDNKAKQINWIISPKVVPIAFSKSVELEITESVKNQFVNAWDIDYRKCHNLFISNEAKSLIATCIDK